MSGPSLKKVANAFAYECISGSEIDDVITHVSAESGPPKKVGDGYQFGVTFHRPRGAPKMYRITVEEEA